MHAVQLLIESTATTNVLSFLALGVAVYIAAVQIRQIRLSLTKKPELEVGFTNSETALSDRHLTNNFEVSFVPAARGRLSAKGTLAIENYGTASATEVLVNIRVPLGVEPEVDKRLKPVPSSDIKFSFIHFVLPFIHPGDYLQTDITFVIPVGFAGFDMIIDVAMTDTREKEFILHVPT